MSGGKKLVLVIDDDDGFRTAVARLVSAGEYEVEQFSTIRDLTERMHGAKGACVLADIVLQKESGLTVGRIIRDQSLKVPIVFMTASDDPKIHLEADRLGAAPCLKKPFEASELFAALNTAFAVGVNNQDIENR